MKLLRPLLLLVLLCGVGCAPADVDVPPPDGAEPAPAAADEGNTRSTDDSFGKQEYIGIMADFLCVERAHPDDDAARKDAHAAVVEKYGFPQKLLDQAAKDLKKEKDVYEQLQKKITAAADELCSATGGPKVAAAAPADAEGTPVEEAEGDPESKGSGED
jgi:hypothetical protein